MFKGKSHSKKKSGIKGMKLIAIKKECYAISGVATTKELKKKYFTLCKNRDFRTRKTWEYVLKGLQEYGDWSNIRISELEELANKEQNLNKNKGKLIFSPYLVEMDKAANNDD